MLTAASQHATHEKHQLAVQLWVAGSVGVLNPLSWHHTVRDTTFHLACCRGTPTCITAGRSAASQAGTGQSDI
jgi:hypothetical protein